MASTPTLSFPAATFAKLSPAPFLLAHLQPPGRSSSSSSKLRASRRPNGRRPHDFRPPAIHTGSLTHADGSAVVRTGDTAVVCGVRAEILLADDIPGYSPTSLTSSSSSVEEIRHLGLLVPNVELSTGCSPSHLAGAAPSTQAQALTARILSLLHAARVIHAADLRIWHRPEPDTDTDTTPTPQLKAFWTLYIDVLFISLDGNAFDAAWAAVLAALADVRLPRAYWDEEREGVLCEETRARASRLRLGAVPVACTFSVFTSPVAPAAGDEAAGKRAWWMLADADAFEEDLCPETVTIVLDDGDDAGDADGGEKADGQKNEISPAHGRPTRLWKVEKNGGVVVGKAQMRELVGLARRRWAEWHLVLKDCLERRS
ncbi:MAG: hypothetical protein M1826_001319 [Phylliscum demangeonii]|nr:MAG: hypothetical protein M1826_001319 [Phylliscum demangeonii]